MSLTVSEPASVYVGKVTSTVISPCWPATVTVTKPVDDTLANAAPAAMVRRKRFPRHKMPLLSIHESLESGK